VKIFTILTNKEFGVALRHRILLLYFYYFCCLVILLDFI